MEGWRELWIFNRISSLVMYLVLTHAPFFLDSTTLHSKMVSMLSFTILIQVTSPTFNLRHLNYSCKIPSQFVL